MDIVHAQRLPASNDVSVIPVHVMTAVPNLILKTRHLNMSTSAYALKIPFFVEHNPFGEQFGIDARLFGVTQKLCLVDRHAQLIGMMIDDRAVCPIVPLQTGLGLHSAELRPLHQTHSFLNRSDFLQDCVLLCRRETQR